MASLMRPARAPTCLQCLRRSAYGELNEVKYATGSLLHTRGKKVKTIQGPKETVLLLKPMKGIGRIGDLVSIETKQMNRVWIPHRIATRLTADEMRAHLAKLAPAQSPEVQQEEIVEPQPVTVAATPAVKPDLLSPATIRSILEETVPTTLMQYCKLIEKKVQENPAEIKSNDTSTDFLTVQLDDKKAAYNALAPKRAAVPGQDIHGSITNQDLRNVILEVLAKDPQSSRVVLNTQDIEISDGDYPLRIGRRIVKTGKYPFTITVTGVREPIQRVVIVRGLAAKPGAKVDPTEGEAVEESPRIPPPEYRPSSLRDVEQFFA